MGIIMLNCKIPPPKGKKVADLLDCSVFYMYII